MATKVKRVLKTGGTAVKYQPCPTCSTRRKGETPVLVNPKQKECRLCYGIRWQRENPVKNFKKKVRARAKMKGAA